MTENPANGIKDMMWHFLMDKGQKENIPELKASVYRLIQMTTQKTAGQPGYAKATHISWETLDMELMRIVMEATALVLSGHLDELDRDKELPRWIPVTERLPEGEDYILVSFENCILPAIARYEEDGEDGVFYPDDSDFPYTKYGIFVNAWMPLPEVYRVKKPR